MNFLEPNDDHLLTQMDPEELSILRFNERVVTTLARKEAAEEKIAAASAVVRDSRLARGTIEFSEVDDWTRSWDKTDGVGEAFQSYVDGLKQMQDARRIYGGRIVGAELEAAYHTVVTAADRLCSLGWPVNWVQNVQMILEATDIGIADGKLVSRQADLPEKTTLGERLSIMGGLAFFKQTDASGKRSQTHVILTGKAKAEYEDIPVFLDREPETFAKRFRYSSDWIDSGKPGCSFRVFI